VKNILFACSYVLSNNRVGLKEKCLCPYEKKSFSVTYIPTYTSSLINNNSLVIKYKLTMILLYFRTGKSKPNENVSEL